MRLSHILVALAATFLATSGALADTNTDSVAKINSAVERSIAKPAPPHRLLRTYKTDVEEDSEAVDDKEEEEEEEEEEERGIENIPLARLQSLGKRVGVSADDVLADAAGTMRTMTKSQVQEWMDGLNRLKKLYKKAKPSRISDY